MRHIISALYSLVLFFYAAALSCILYIASCLPVRWREPWFGICCRQICFGIIGGLGIKPRMHHGEHMRRFQQVIFISNHPSQAEIFLLPALIPRLTALIEAESLAVPVFGRIFAASGSVFIHRQSIHSRRAGLAKLYNKLGSGENVIIFPEGRPGKYIGKKFYRGAFYLSKKTGLPIIPLYIHYADREAFKVDRSVSEFQLMLKILRSLNKRVDLYCFEPVFPDQYPDLDTYCKNVYQQYIDWERQFHDADSFIKTDIPDNRELFI